ncbi:ROK family protein [Clostridium estertheticum]|nr:ROK family protein [Clostridium estertheticum]MBZ9689291.1 ROK family protein [Clostridium estertheticum]
MKYVIGVDLGGTKISCALADLSGKVIEIQVVATNASEGEIAVLNRIISVIDKVMLNKNTSKEDIKAIGIGAPGPLDARKGIIVEPANLPFKNFDLVTPIVDKFNIPVYLDNDASVAAIGEFMFGAAKGTENMIYITVSTGIGGGAILNGQVYRGRTTNALEIGHTTVEPFSSARCNCGNLGCLEALASGTAIAKRAKDAASSNINTSLKGYEIITAYEVFKEAENGDKVAISIRDNALRYLGIGVTNIINTFDPDIVVIGGGVSKAGEIIFDKVKEVVNERGLKTMTAGCEIVPAKLGTDAGVIGAVALAILQS